MSSGLQHPQEFLEVRVHNLSESPGLTGLCAGYEGGDWRSEQLASHLMEWLPEFALTHSEREAMQSHNAVALISQAARTVYTTTKYRNRGEIGELLLHVAVRQVFDTVPAIAKLFYKDSGNDTVKGFDAVHVIVDDDSLELWLGEAKFYKDVGDAIRDIVDEIKKHTERDYLREEFAAITNKIDGSWPHADRLRQLLHKNTSLDEVFHRIRIPAFIAYESATITAHDHVDQGFESAFTEEVNEHYADFATRPLPTQVFVHLFLLPMKDKDELVNAFDHRLKAWQDMIS